MCICTSTTGMARSTFQASARSLLCAAVLSCNECYLEHVAWESSRSFDVFGPETGKPVVLVHGALVGRQCLVLEAKALAEAGFRCGCQVDSASVGHSVHTRQISPCIWSGPVELCICDTATSGLPT